MATHHAHWPYVHWPYYQMKVLVWPVTKNIAKLSILATLAWDLGVPGDAQLIIKESGMVLLGGIIRIGWLRWST